METQYFSQFFEGCLKEKGISIKKLSEVSGISIKHLEALKNDEFLALPPAPYVRGYINKLGKLFGFDPDDWWKKIKTTELNTRSSTIDAPPKNRFIKRPLFKKGVAIALGVIVVISLFGLGSPRIFGKPSIIVRYPDKNPAVAASKKFTLEGTVAHVSELYINDELVKIGESGLWEKTIVLEGGMNPIEIKAKKFLGGETKILQQIIYEPANTSLNQIPITSGI